MGSWRACPSSPGSGKTPPVEVHRMVVGPMDNNVYIAALPAHRARRCWSTPPTSTRRCSRSAERLGVRQVVETHGHWDHIQAVPARARGRLRGRGDGRGRRHAAQLRPVLEDDAVLEVGRLRLRTVATPGHTPGSMCFAVEGTPLLLSGDTLFPGGPGQHQVRGRRLPDHHPLHRRRRFFCPVRRRHHRPARPRGDHDRGHRGPQPRRVGRTGLVSRPPGRPGVPGITPSGVV